MGDKFTESRVAYETGAQGYGEYWSKPMEFTELDRTQLRNRLAPSSRILEVGCGPGNDAQYFSAKGYEVIGTDLSEELLAIARRRVPEVDFQEMDMRRLAFEDQQFDAVWSSFSFLHVEQDDTAETLAGFRRVLKEGGLLYIAAHTADESAYVRRVISGLMSHSGEQLEAYVQEWRREDLVASIEDSGFRCDKIRQFTRSGGLYPLISIIARRI